MGSPIPRQRQAAEDYVPAIRRFNADTEGLERYCETDPEMWSDFIPGEQFEETEARVMVASSMCEACPCYWPCRRLEYLNSQRPKLRKMSGVIAGRLNRFED